MTPLDELAEERDRIVKAKAAVEAEVSRARFAGKPRTPEHRDKILELERLLKQNRKDLVEARSLAVAALKEAKAEAHEREVNEQRQERNAAYEDLVPCPFCGSIAVLNARSVRDVRTRRDFEMWYVMCSHIQCGCSLKTVATKSKAVRMWNRRAIALRAVQPGADALNTLLTSGELKKEWLLDPPK